MLHHWSIASFIKPCSTGRYFNRLGPRPLIIVGAVFFRPQDTALTNVTPATSHRVTDDDIRLNGQRRLCSSTAQWRFPDIARRDMPDASALWNLNRQIGFFP